MSPRGPAAEALRAFSATRKATVTIGPLREGRTTRGPA